MMQDNGVSKPRRSRFKWLSMFTAGIIACSSWLSVPFAPQAAASTAITIQVDTSRDRGEISPYIYGTNQDFSEHLTVRRFGGNRTTGYNWENNMSNAGSDWYHSSDNYACTFTETPEDKCNEPGGVLSTFHEQSIAQGAYSLITLPLAGYVSRDGNGTVLESETAPSHRWDEVVYRKGAPFTLTPDLNDGKVYVDEEVHFLVHKYGNASTPTGVKGYSLDNEPALWPHTHPRIHPNITGVQELLDRSIALASAVKDVDPYAEIFGPALYGYAAYTGLQDAEDWEDLRGDYGWFIDYYLDHMRQASEAEGKRLLDVLDVHWYPEARGDDIRITDQVGTNETRKARLQAPRTLWDPTYIEDSWIGQWGSHHLPLLPTLQQSIDTYYPGTKLAITEFNYGAQNEITGGIAMVDVLGIFGKYDVYMSNFWLFDGGYDYVKAAYELYRNYDGSRSTYGDIRVYAETSDIENSSAYASVTNETNDELHLIVLNKSLDTPLEAKIQVTSNQLYRSGEVYGFDEASPEIRRFAAIPSIDNNQFTYTIPPLTAYHMVLKTEEGDGTDPPQDKPDSVTGISAQTVLTWNASEGADSYNIKRATNPEGPYQLIANVRGTSYTDTSLEENVTYYYSITAVNEAGESPAASLISIKIGSIELPDPDEPGPGEPGGPGSEDPVPQPDGDLVVQYMAADTDPVNNQIKPHFNIVNRGASPVNMSDLKLRYYFTKDGSEGVNAWIDWAEIGSSNIQTVFTDSYVELRFTSGAGSIPAGGQSGIIQLRMSKENWSNFDESDDYSFDPSKTSFADWERVTLYQNDQLVWGIEPSN